MDVLTVKILAMVLLGGISLVLGLLPMLFRKCLRKNPAEPKTSKTDTLISCLACFGGGVILTTCLTHMLPEVNMLLNQNIESGHLPNTGMPIAEILVLSGFFMIYIVEEVTHICINNCYGRDKGTKGQAEVSPMMSPNHQAQVKVDDHTHGDEFILMHPMDSNSSFEAALRGFLVILALSLHAVFEGIALGLTGTANSVWFLFFAIASHKFVISFCIGMQFVSSDLRPCLHIIYVSTFAIISPIGTAIGIALSETVDSEAALQNGLVTILQGLATGTLLYVVFFEIIEKERSKGTNGLLQITFLVLGFMCMILLELVEVKGMGSTEVSSADGPHCFLTQINTKWPLPLNMTCKSGVLIPNLD